MQTFLPFADFKRTVRVLDYRRLGKQRVEAFQILKALQNPENQWNNHPAVKMWIGYDAALTEYMNICIREWVRRGYVNTMLMPLVKDYEKPNWLGDRRFHSAHRAALLYKDPQFYGAFNWKEEPKLSYIWPKSSYDVTDKSL